jgi:hypothetical protein
MRRAFVTYGDRITYNPEVMPQCLAKFIASWLRTSGTGVTLKWAEVTGQSSILVVRDGTAVALATIDASAQGKPVCTLPRTSSLSRLQTLSSNARPLLA